MGVFGLSMLVCALALMMTTGWPTYAVLLGVCTIGAIGGLAAGAFDLALLSNLPGRIIGLLDQDLLQALALYALVGALLNRLALADNLYGGLHKVLARRAPNAAPELAGLGLGLVLAPMNGSVGASLMTLARTAGARWAAEDRPPARRAALVALASTLGVIVPPSLVLLLLGDAMLRAHTEGLNLARALGVGSGDGSGVAQRIVNTQDVLQAALVPGALLLVCWIAIVGFSAPRSLRSPRSKERPEKTPIPTRERWTLALVPLVVGSLLTLVALGKVRAVEAAATAGVLLLVWGVVSRQLNGARLRLVLDDAMAMTGALFALLAAATTFSLLLRAFGTDLLVAQTMQRMQGHPVAAMLTVLGVLLACAFVLDAFELIFLVVPIVMPPLLAQVGDAAWVAALTLLVLQAGFLLPPFGYAVVLARGQTAPRPSLGAMARMLAPFLAALLAVIAFTILVPASTQWLRSAPASVGAATPMDAEKLDRLMREMSGAPADPAPEATGGAPAR